MSVDRTTAIMVFSLVFGLGMSLLTFSVLNSVWEALGVLALGAFLIGVSAFAVWMANK